MVIPLVLFGLTIAGLAAASLILLKLRLRCFAGPPGHTLPQSSRAFITPLSP